MTARVAVVTARHGDPWDELSVLAGRLAGGLACTADVDVLVPARGRAGAETGWDGACRVLRFPAELVDSRRRGAWRRLLHGSHPDDLWAGCVCPPAVRTRPIPDLVEEQIVLAEGGDSPDLYEHLRTTAYDVTVFVGFHSPVTCFGVRHVPESTRVFIAPGMRDAAAAKLQIHRAAVNRAERLLVSTESERRWVADWVGTAHSGRVENIAFLTGVNPAVGPEAAPFDGGRFVVVARDWGTGSARRFAAWARRLADDLPTGIGLRLVGPGARWLPSGVDHTDTRVDAWWWMSRALAVIDPAPRRVLGVEVLEAMMFGKPVIVAADGAATVEHSDVGNGGLWYRGDDELVAMVGRLRDVDLAACLGERGRSYAESRFADTDTYVKRLGELLPA